VNVVSKANPLPRSSPQKLRCKLAANARQGLTGKTELGAEGPQKSSCSCGKEERLVQRRPRRTISGSITPLVSDTHSSASLSRPRAPPHAAGAVLTHGFTHIHTRRGTHVHKCNRGVWKRTLDCSPPSSPSDQILWPSALRHWSCPISREASHNPTQGL